MDDTAKNIAKAILVFGAGYVIFRLTRPAKRKTFTPGAKEMKEVEPDVRTPIKAPTMSAKDAKANPTAAKAFTALKAYIAAYNAGEPQDKLDEVNKEIANDMGMTVYRRRGDNKLAVKDLSGKDIIVNSDN